MKPNSQSEPFETEQRITALIRTLRAAEKELQELMGSGIDLVATESGQPYLLREAQEKLLHSEAALRQLAETQLAILNALPAHIALVDSQGMIVSVNEAWQRPATATLLQGPEAGTGQNYFEVCERVQGPGSLEAQATAAGLRRVLSGEIKEFAVEYPCLSPAGKRWFRLMVSPLNEGQPAGAVVMHLNVTERRLAEETLQTREREQRQLAQQLEKERLRLVSAQAVGKVGSWETDLAIMTVIWSEETHRIFETDPAGFMVTHQNFLQLVHPEDRRKVDEAFAASLSHALPGAIEHRILLADGRVKRVEERWQIFRDDTGKPVRAIGTCQDVTERTRAEEALRKSESLLRIAGHAARLGGWTIDLPSHKLTWSDEICAIHDRPPGYSPKFEEGLNYYLPEHRVEVLRQIAACERDGTPYDFELPKVTAKGRRIWVRSIGEAVRNSEGKIIRLQGAFQDITERHQNEEQLRLLENCVSRLNDIVLITEAEPLDEPGPRILFVNDTFERLTGYTRDEVMGKTPRILQGPQTDRAELARIRKALEKKQAVRAEVINYTKTGEAYWIEIDMVPILSDTGKTTHFVAIQRNIAERKKTELALARSNRALRMLSACNETLIHATEEKLLLTDVCRIAVEIGGYRMAWVGYAKNDEFRTITPVAHAGEEQGYLNHIKLSWSETEASGRGPAARTIRGGQPVVCEDITQDAAAFSWLEAAQERGYRSVICLPLREASNTFGLLALYSSETSQLGADDLRLLEDLANGLAFGIISLRARAQHLITEQQIVQQAALLDQATDAIVVRDLEDRVQFWNQSAERIYGWSADQAFGKSVKSLLLAEAAGFENAMQTVFQTGEWHGELNQQNQGGRAITMDCRWKLMRDEQGRPKSVLCIETDITEKKKLKSQFLRNQRMESIGTLASGIAHDLNNVLAPILISVQILKQDTKNPESLKMLDTLEVCSRRGADLVKQVLSFSRGLEGQQVVINPGHIFRELEKVLRETFPKSIAFIFDIDKNLWTVTGDPTHLHQVFMNLCVNARDAMPNGGNLTIKLKNKIVDETYAAMNPDSKPGSYVEVTIGDTGTGIPPEIREKIFEPFFTTKAIGQGTGLGLSTSSGIIKGHGGFISLYSELGKGTKFKIYLPANVNQATVEKTPVKPAEFPRGHGELVLLVDDEEGIRKIAKKTLERFGYNVLLAANGAEAIALYASQQNEIAVILTDMAMPVMDGPALIIAVRAINPRAKIIGSSGNASKGGLAKSTGAGIQHFIPKPYTAETMLRTLREALQDSDGPTQ